MLIKIHITSEILEKSKMCSKERASELSKNNIVFNCAISMAVRDLFPFAVTEIRSIILLEENQVEDYLNITKKCEFYKLLTFPQIILPTEAVEFIYEFDEKSPEERVKMSPISFEIDFPDELVEKIGIEEVKGILNNSKTLELAV